MNEDHQVGDEPAGVAVREVSPGDPIQAVEAWYAGHFHRCALEGRTPITADEKAALVQSVADAAAPTSKE